MNKTKNKTNLYRQKAYIWLALGIILLTFALIYLIIRPKDAYKTPETDTNANTATSTQTEIIEKPVPTRTIPATYNISLPYAPQAPYSNWTVHEESCEEAAIYMYRGYLEGLQYPGNRISDADADNAFRAMKSWQVTNYGKEPDLTMTALGDFARSYYGYTPVVEKSITADNVKSAVSSGHPVIVPVMTHSLENNMYGPISVYHVLLIKGYDAAGVITNDAGVGNGVDKHYTWDILWQAIDAQTTKMGVGREMLYLTK